MSNETSTRSPLTPTQRWGLGLCAILTEMNRDEHHTLFGRGDTPEDLERTRHSLHRDWGIDTRDDLLDMLKRLETEGHNRGYMRRHRYLATLSDAEREREVARFKGDIDRYHEQLIIRNNLAILDNVGIEAWDLGRYVNLCRWGMTLGLMEENEGWRRIIGLSIYTQRRFNGWFHFAVSYVTGRQYWRSLATKDYIDEQMLILKRLTGNPESPWNALDWDMQLTQLAEFES